ncbi:hypothetical protein BT96DRAFT_1008364 [Gymnopus androsaceus JB14]|uniref:Uncharacterized protein n=1 Tax=Gymnopus androsaceus JB14 TaxID=1447944 RepID=A0A6A4GFN2_9AGAR|nr:hypothetical protein BT96DRAFT_1008364 [Gymnopus androsaceus JB14]
MPPASPVWNYFYKSLQFYKGNKTHKKSLCKACIQKVVHYQLNCDNEALAQGQHLRIRDNAGIEREVIQMMFDSTGTVRIFGTVEVHILKGQVDVL